MSEKDTLAEWLYYRFSKSQLFEDRDWRRLHEDDKSFWEHEANAVRRAVARGGFKESGAFDTVLLKHFGDHAMVTVRKDGIEVEYYSHD